MNKIIVSVNVSRAEFSCILIGFGRNRTVRISQVMNFMSIKVAIVLWFGLESDTIDSRLVPDNRLIFVSYI